MRYEPKVGSENFGQECLQINMHALACIGIHKILTNDVLHANVALWEGKGVLSQINFFLKLSLFSTVRIEE